MFYSYQQPLMHEQYQYQKAHSLFGNTVPYQVTKYMSMLAWVQTEYLQPTEVNNIPEASHSFSEVSMNFFNFVCQIISTGGVKITKMYNTRHMAIKN